MSAAVVGVVVGSRSDLPAVAACTKVLDQLGIGHELHVLSAHRQPEATASYARSAAGRGLKVLIGVAGLSAALPGALAAHSDLPVIGVPLAANSLGGLDALLAASQMPPGVPVAATTIGEPGCANAAWLAARILALTDPQVSAGLQRQRATWAAAAEQSQVTPDAAAP